MELTTLLAMQHGFSDVGTDGSEYANGTSAYGNPGIGIRYAGRLYEAYRHASYVDFHERLWPMSLLLPRLEWKPRTGQQRNPNWDTSYILLTWLESQFASYCKGRRVGFVGAEAALLQALLKQPAFHDAAAKYWPEGATVYFHQVRNDGQNLHDNVESILDDISTFVVSNDLDTVFVSLGGAAKIACAELAASIPVRMVDFGAMLRSLTYSGSDGNAMCRSTHFPFLYKLPFGVWCDAMKHAWPSMGPRRLLAKVHAQLILELQRKTVGWTHSSTELEFSDTNRESF